MNIISPEIYPCILAENLQEYVVKLEMIEKSHATWAQVDFIDGQFVDKKTVLPADIKGIPSAVQLEAHLMVVNPNKYYQDLRDSGYKRVLIHRENCSSLEDCAKEVSHAKKYFSEVGLVINPDTEVEDYSICQIDSLQCMAVHPGASGQLLLSSIYDTIKKVKDINSGFVIAVDGGVNSENIEKLREVGVQRFVMASSIFANQDVDNNFQHFLQLITQGGI